MRYVSSLPMKLHGLLPNAFFHVSARSVPCNGYY